MIPSEQEDIANNFNHRENKLAEEITPIGVLRGGGKQAGHASHQKKTMVKV